MNNNNKEKIIYLKEGESHPRAKKKFIKRILWSEQMAMNYGGNWSKMQDQGRNQGRKK